ncbi:MAG: ABC transporter permease [Gemmatimonadetes bacterium]|nr:ABC transporter permease [Gemmatimonadota bacterium]|tara:strand:+ start:160 stop:966 length:807 start_codon:yes stop_codon:yes gene_type:complete
MGQEPQNDNRTIDWSALTSMDFAGAQIAIILGIALAVISISEVVVRALDIPTYVFPPPSEIIKALFKSFHLFWPHLLITLQELGLGYIIGALIGITLAAVITQFPFVEKIVTPYILILVTTPMLALVPLLILKFGFGQTPRVIAVALAVGPMVMINSATGFRRTDLPKIALAKSYGASTFQIFYKIRFPLALPMIIVGLMVGGIFGLLTAIGAEMVGGGSGLGNRLVYYSSLARMSNFFAVIILIAAIGIGLYVIFYLIGKKWANWEA